MNQVTNIEERLRAHEEGAFPAGYRGKSIDGIDLTVMDCDGVAAVHSIIASAGLLSSRGQLSLEKIQQELAKVTPQLEGEALSYFSRLQKIVDDAAATVKPRS